MCSNGTKSNPPGRVCAPQARPPARRRRKFWGINPPVRVLGRKPSREGFRAETLPGGFWGGNPLPGGFWGENPPGRVLGRKPSREGFRSANKPCRQGLFVAQSVNPPGRVCVSADYHPTIYSGANPPDRVFGANRKPSREGRCASADYHPTIDLRANPPDRFLAQTVHPPRYKN